MNLDFSSLKTFSLIQRLIKCHSVKTRVLSLIYSGHSKINIFEIYMSHDVVTREISSNFYNGMMFYLVFENDDMVSFDK